MIELKPKKEKEYYFNFIKDHIEDFDESEVKLEKKLRCDKYRISSPIPKSFIKNTYKEELILKNVKKFEKKFKKIFQNRKLYLYPKNECGIPKFIPTTIRPTKTRYKNLSEYLSCILYISNFIKYEELEDSKKPPDFAASPYNIIKWQVGDSLDMAILNVSFLIGAGYNAFVCMGYATQEVTSKDESELDYINYDLDCEKNNIIDLNDEKYEGEKSDNMFYIEKPGKIESEIEKTKKKIIFNKEKEIIFNNKINDDEPERPKKDKLNGKRLHFWILIKKNDQRKIKKNIFIDPPSCTLYEVNSENMPFFGILQIFNNRNVWINKYPDKLINELFIEDFKNAEDTWVKVLDNNLDINSKVETNSFSQEDYKENLYETEKNIFDAKKEHKNQLLDRPLSWVPKFEISQEHYLRGSKNLKYSRFYKKMQIDYYSEYQQTDGLIKKETKFEDYKRLIVKDITFYYKNRKDNLYKKKNFPFEFRSIDYYKNNTQHFQQNNNWPHWKEIETISSVKRIIRFYPLRFKDGLIEREEIIGEKIIERYQNRDDKLIYSSVRFEKKINDSKKNAYSFIERNIGTVNIIKMVQKYEKNSLIEANDQISKLIVDLRREHITVYYHLNDHEISPIEYIISRDEFTGISSNFNKQFNSDLSLEKKKEIYGLEKDCYSKIKYAEKAMGDDFKKFKYSFEEKIEKFQEKINTKKNIDDGDKFNILIESNFLAKKKKKKEIKIFADENNELFDKEDIIGHNLKEKGLLGKKMDKDTIDNIKIEIINNFQNRYFERSEIMNQRFEEEKNKVLNLEKKYQRKANENIDKEEEKLFEKELYNFNLKLSILEQRLFNFQKTAYEKYEDLQKKINDDPRLKYND